MLALVIANRHLVGVVRQDVCGLKRGVRKQTGGNERCFVPLVLELDHPRKLAIGTNALHDPPQFRMYGNVGLNEKCAFGGIDPDRDQTGRHVRGVPAKGLGVLRQCDRVKVDDRDDDIHGVQQLWPTQNGPEKVA